jgi:hypothetical protein
MRAMLLIVAATRALGRGFRGRTRPATINSSFSLVGGRREWASAPSSCVLSIAGSRWRARWRGEEGIRSRIAFGWLVKGPDWKQESMKVSWRDSSAG